VINALLFYLVGRLVSGFYVAGFGTALEGALVVSATNFIASRLTRPPPPPPVSRRKAPPDDVIDI
jgi:putative membrane protein